MRKIIFSVITILVYSAICPAQENTIPQSRIVNGMAISLPKPIYSKEAENICADGTVTVAVEIDENGDVVSASGVAGDEFLYAASVEAVKKAKFRQTHNGEIPIKVRGNVVYNFVKPIRCINKGVVNSSAKFLPIPEYPKSCRCSGSVLVQVVVDVEGKITRAKAVSGHPLLRISAEKAARLARFAPMNDVGEIRVKAFLLYKFDSDGKIKTNFDSKETSKTHSNKITVSCGQCNSKAIFITKPDYPKAAVAVGASGEVIVEVLIDETGNVETAKITSGHPLLWSVSEKAARNSRFKPKLIGGKIVKFYDTIVYKFSQ